MPCMLRPRLGRGAHLSIEFADGRVGADRGCGSAGGDAVPPPEPKPVTREAKPAAPKRVEKKVDQGSLF